MSMRFLHGKAKWAMLVIMTMCVSLPAVAEDGDGGQLNNEPGTKWVDPVEFFNLQGINRTDFQRAYDQGDIDFNKVLKESGAKVLGLRLKPIAGAAWIEKYIRITALQGEFISGKVNYQKHYGVEGAPIHEAAFCVYTHESVSRSYSFEYTWQSVIGTKEPKTNHVTSHVTISINGLQLVPTESGIGFSYAMNTKMRDVGAGGKYYHSSGMWDSDGIMEYNMSKPAGVNGKFGKFIYFKGARDLLVMLSSNAAGVSTKFLTDEENAALSNNAWPRVFFIVEEIMISDDTAPLVTEEDRVEMINYMDDLVTWLKGEGDPLGLGEHSSALESAVINTIGVVASILIGNGVASVVGGSGASIASGLTEAILGGASGGTPPPVPDTPDMNGLEPKRKEEEEEDEVTPVPPTEPEPVDPNKFNPKDYPYGDQFLHQQADGDIVMKSPVTGKDVHYYSNGDGTWSSDSGCTYNADDIAERLRFEAENSGVLRQDAETAARNVAEQHAQWEAQNQRDLERGYSDEQKAYQDWKQAQADAEKKQENLEKLAEKYHTAANEEAIRKAMKYEQIMRELDQNIAHEQAKAWDDSVKYLETVDKTCEVGVNLMSGCVPGGAAVKNAYTFAKSTLVATSEAIAEGKSMGEGAAHVLVGMGNGALGVIQNEAGNIAQAKGGGWMMEYGITVGTQVASDAATEYYESGDVAKAFYKGVNSIGSKTAEFGASKAISGVLGFVKDSAAQTLDPSSATFETDTGFRFSEKTAKTIDKIFNQKWNTELKTNIGIKGTNIDVDDALGTFKFTSTSNVTFGGQIDGGALIEGGINELLGQNDAYDPAGNLTEGLTKDVVDFAEEIKKFSNTAAKFRRKG